MEFAGLKADKRSSRLMSLIPERVFLVAKLPGTATGGTLSPDGREAIVSVSEVKPDLWLIDDFDSADLKP